MCLCVQAHHCRCYWSQLSEITRNCQVVVVIFGVMLVLVVTVMLVLVSLSLSPSLSVYVYVRVCECVYMGTCVDGCMGG